MSSLWHDGKSRLDGHSQQVIFGLGEMAKKSGPLGDIKETLNTL
jgi:hypothetical protein